MTSQLVLGNGFGLALASDSAQTGGTEPRTYEAAEKVHPLEPPHRLAVLTAGHVHFLGMPISVLVNEWKDSLGKRSRSVEGYRESFLAWLDDNLDNWTNHRQRDDEAFDAAVGQIRHLHHSVLSTAIRGTQESQQPELALAALRSHNEDLARRPGFDPNLLRMADDFFDRWNREGDEDPPRPALFDLLEMHFDDVPRSEEIDKEIHEFLRLVVAGGHRFPSHATNQLVFVGYGDKDLVPAVSCVDLRGALGDNAVRHLWGDQAASRHGSSYALIVPLAQYDTIDLILRGHNPRLLREAAQATIERSRGAIGEPVKGEDGSGDTVSSDTVENEANAPKSFTEAGFEMFRDEAEELSQERNVGPALRTIAGIPLASLAGIAGSLVSAQNLVQNIRGELPTVGGNIDIATITLDEGFKWVSHNSRVSNNLSGFGNDH